MTYETSDTYPERSIRSRGILLDRREVQKTVYRVTERAQEFSRFTQRWLDYSRNSSKVFISD